MQSILSLQDVCYAYHTLQKEVPVIDHISFEVKPGDFLSIVGPSGCGKSTLLNLICQLLTPDEGRIYYQGQLLPQKGLPIGYMLQKDHLLEWRTVLENVLLGLEIRHAVTPGGRKRAEELLRTYGLYDFKDAYPRQLSGGMRQRAALIRTLLQDPQLMLLDEPFSALDYQTRLSVSDDIYHILRQEKRSALLVTHDISEAISMSDRVIVLSATPAKILKDLPIIFEKPGASPLEKRSLPEFNAYFHLIWEELHEKNKKT